MKNKVFRILVSVILICTLVVSWSPIRARATSVPVVGWDSFAYNIAEIIASAVMGLGTSEGAQESDFNQLCNDAWDAWCEAFYVAMDTITVYRYLNGDGIPTYYVKQEFVEWLRDWLWNPTSGEPILVDPTSIFPANAAAQLNAYIAQYCSGFGVSECYTYIMQAQDGTASIYLACYPLVLDGGYYYSFNGTTKTNMWRLDWTGLDYLTKKDGVVSYAWPGYKESYFYGLVPVSTDLDLALGHIASFELPFADGYPEWEKNLVTIPAGTLAEIDADTAVLPVGLGQTLEETKGLTQEQIWAGESTLQVEIEEALDGTVAGTTWVTFTQWLGNQIGLIPKQILEGIAAIFVPAEDFLTLKWEAIRAEFAFADSITSTGELLVGVLNGLDPEAPVIYIDLGAAEGSYNIGGEVAFVDLRWYERYKPTMDLIISAFLWLAFIWRLILKLPGIISGMPGEFVLMNLPVNIPLTGIGSGQRREQLEAGRTTRRLGDGH